MANSTIRFIVTQVQRRIVDEEEIRWTIQDLIDYFNSAVKAVMVVRPDAYVKTEEFACTQGTKQTLPEGINLLFNVLRNVNGPAIRGPHDMLMLDNYYPDWRNGTAQSNAETYMYEERNPSVFYLYPAVTEQHKIEIVASFIPDPISKTDYDGNQVSPLGPLYDNALIEYMIYLAFSQDNEFAANSNKANLALAAFNTMLGNKNQSDAYNATSYQRNQNKPR